MSRSPNKLLSFLSDSDHAILVPHLEQVELPHRFVVEAPNTEIEYVYFPESGVASVIGISETGERVEVHLYGHEGMSGACVVNGAGRTPLTTVMQIPGKGQRISSAAFEAAMHKSPSLKSVFLLYNQAASIQMAHTALSNARHSLDQRLARWLLMSHDRMGMDEMPLTHEFLAVMLGVRRAGVTTALHVLEGAQIIRATRGQIEVRNRALLEEAAGDSYGLPEAEYRRLFKNGVEIVTDA